eukprot:TRINITY_DN5151_c0_g1_i2.p1 TRINITY_DN5151_c0_g1~~TRINITY_DN5151_c0_g1_i2.p1  ORF type:complete len:486 (+),score=121.27 TRINITY_DN5151_c0_g1_i2:2357-3814(+)
MFNNAFKRFSKKKQFKSSFRFRSTASTRTASLQSPSHYLKYLAYATPLLVLAVWDPIVGELRFKKLSADDDSDKKVPTHLNRIIDENREHDLFEIIEFDHLEWFVGDATTALKVFKLGFGMNLVAESKHETGNHDYCSYVLQTQDVRWVITSPYLSNFQHPDNNSPDPNFDGQAVTNFLNTHGSGVGVIGLKVGNATQAYNTAVKNGAVGHREPYEILGENGSVIVSEIGFYGDVKLRFVEYKGYEGAFLPGFKNVDDKHELNYQIKRMDHVVGNVYDMDETINHIKKVLGFHTFAKFSKEDIATKWTSLNSEVLANEKENVLLPINEPAPGKKESQITEYLKANNGPGVQHIALFTPDVLNTINYMRVAGQFGGFEFIPAMPEYYNDKRVKDIMDRHLSPEVQDKIKEYGILVDEDAEGALLQIFTKPLFDRPTIFVEIIQRLCHGQVIDKPGCGGFGKGNFRALFQSIERMQAERHMLLDTEE